MSKRHEGEQDRIVIAVQGEKNLNKAENQKSNQNKRGQAAALLPRHGERSNEVLPIFGEREELVRGIELDAVSKM